MVGRPDGRSLRRSRLPEGLALLEEVFPGLVGHSRMHLAGTIATLAVIGDGNGLLTGETTAAGSQSRAASGRITVADVRHVRPYELDCKEVEQRHSPQLNNKMNMG